jgi:hypothetical protein
MFFCSCLALALCDDPMLDTDSFAGVRVGPTSDVSCSKDARRAGLEVLVGYNSTVHRQFGLFCERNGRTYTNTKHEEIGVHSFAIIQRDFFPINTLHSRSEVKDDAVRFVQFLNLTTKPWPQHVFKRMAIRRHYMNFDLALSQRGRHLEPDKACTADDNALCFRGLCDDGPAICEGAQ